MATQYMLKDDFIFESSDIQMHENFDDRNGTVLASFDMPLADYQEHTRNGRLYTRSLWDSVINSSTVKEMLETKTLFGEAHHPEERLEVKLPEVSHAIRNFRLDDSRGWLIGTVDILNTPNGRILKTFIDYGSKLGASSRGSGSVENDGTVDEHSYNFVTFDIIPLPSNKVARMPKDKVTSEELVGAGVVSLKESLEAEVNYLVEDCNDKQKLDDFKKVLSSSGSSEYKTLVEKLESKMRLLETDRSNSPVEGNDEIIQNLRTNLDEAYKRIMDLKAENSKLIEELQTGKKPKGKEGNDRFKKLQEELSKVKKTKDKLSDRVVGYEDAVAGLQEQLDECYNYIEDLENEVDGYEDLLEKKDRRIKELYDAVNEREQMLESYEADLQNTKESYENKIKEYKEQLRYKNEDVQSYKSELDSLNESYHNVASEVQDLQEQVNKYKKHYDNLSKQYDDDINYRDNLIDDYESTLETLSSEVENLKEENAILIDESEDNLEYYKSRNEKLEQKVSQLNETVKNYSHYEQFAVDYYAEKLGITSDSIREKLPNNFTYSQLKALAESYDDVYRRSKKLPFALQRGNDRLKESGGSKTSSESGSASSDQMTKDIIRNVK